MVSKSSHHRQCRHRLSGQSAGVHIMSLLSFDSHVSSSSYFFSPILLGPICWLPAHFFSEIRRLVQVTPEKLSPTAIHVLEPEKLYLMLVRFACFHLCPLISISFPATPAWLGHHRTSTPIPDHNLRKKKMTSDTQWRELQK
jgi:hypothetical protein